VKVYQSLEEFTRLDKAIVTIGTFDGVHMGHQRILSRLRETALNEQAETVVLTFFPHPRMVLQPDDNSLQLITTLQERERLLGDFGIDHLIIQPFSKEFSRMTAVEFVRDLLVNKIGLHTLVIGYDHHFGRNREGSYRDLEEMAPVYGYRLEEIPRQVVNELAVSSTKIRQSLLAGDVHAANELLGHAFTLTGTVIEGDRIGRTIGFPTANLAVRESYKLIPADGIYAVWVEHEGKRFKGMLYIGHRPVVNGTTRNIEVNIFDFDRDIYGQALTLHLKARMRDDKKISTLEELKLLLEADRLNATKILS
jgi:riboflavin kinase/FMN adenylyltransferase